MSWRDLGSLDLRYCAAMNRFATFDPLRALFIVVSRLGDGVLWYALILALPVLYPDQGLSAAVDMALAGAIALIVYRLVKSRTARLRPFMVDPAILARVRPLDQYSFPSGHTLQAVALTVVACHHIPELVWTLGPFTALVAVSRPVLGLHFPSDVIIGAVLGWLVAIAILQLPLPA